MSWLNPFVDDEKLGKKNDDHRPRSHMQPSSWSAQPAQVMRKRRLIYLICGALFVFLFIKNLPTDVGPHRRWADTRTYRGPISDGGRIGAPSTSSSGPTSPSKRPPRPASPSESEEHYHDGPIKFYKLAASLHAVAKFGGQRDQNKNVLFAASNLKSISELLPLACEMARWNRNDVHLAVMGRDEMGIQEIQNLNGVAEEDCNVHWHDARPDFSKWSTDFRMESSVAASLEHIQTFIHPQVILIDRVKREDGYHVNAIREKALDLSTPLIELPSNAMENLMWITRLDSASLAAWPKVYIDIVIQPPPASSGSLVRLLKSLEDADYFGARRPHLTIELPPVVESPTAAYLNNFVWPPIEWSGAAHASQVTLRHRIPRKTTTVEEASARLVESFWPKRNAESHVLLLSTQLELSPLYFHYLFYCILEYKYSHFARANGKYQNLMGISLHLPDIQLDDKTPLKPPKMKRSKEESDPFPGSKSPFLWQAPNNDAALYFGDKWMEFHSFLSLRLTKPPSTTTKKVNESHPAWMEYLLELLRLRGYSLLYPGAFLNDFTITTVHDELYQVPEEFKKRPEPSESSNPPPAPDTPLEANSTPRRRAPPNKEKSLLETSLVGLLPNKGDLLEVDKMPFLNSTGDIVTFKENLEEAKTASEEFQRTTGGCVHGRKPPRWVMWQAVDLFCDPNEPFEYHKEESPKNHPETHEPPKEDLPHDPDQISAAQAENAKQEGAKHLDRQAGYDAKASEKPTEVEAVKQKMLKEKQGNSHENGKTNLDLEDERMQAATKDAKKKIDGDKASAEEPEKKSKNSATKAADAKDAKASKPVGPKKQGPEKDLNKAGEQKEEDEKNRSPGW